jgi:adenylate cyclase
MRISLRTKLMVFAAAIAALPLIVAGQSVITVARDELKSTANEQLAGTARQITDEFNAFLEYSLYPSLDLIRNSIGGNKLGFESKIAVLRQGIEDLPDVVSLQVNVERALRPLVVVQQGYFDRLKEGYDDPLETLRVKDGEFDPTLAGQPVASGLERMEKTGDWLATVSLPIPDGVGDRPAILHARILLSRLRDYVANHPFARTGAIHVVNGRGDIVFAAESGEYEHASVLAAGLERLTTRNATIAVEPYDIGGGEISLAAVSLTRPFPWAFLVEKKEADAYAPVADMVRNLAQWLGIGIVAALGGALFFALGISRPILKIGEAATHIAAGKLDFRVRGVESRDEIGDLARRFNDMIVQLNERFELQKFVSAGTMRAIQGNDARTVSLGGERRRVTILFADIRGYTAFSENRSPEEVVEILNRYFQRLADVVVEHNGDIDKYVGDQIMAVFTGEDMCRQSVECGLAMVDVMEELAPHTKAELRIGIGVNVGEVVVGAMGSSQRKDFTVLGDPVNLAARLCSAAGPDETLASRAVMEELPAALKKEARELEPIKVKGKSGQIEIFSFVPQKIRAGKAPAAAKG